LHIVALGKQIGETALEKRSIYKRPRMLSNPAALADRTGFRIVGLQGKIGMVMIPRLSAQIQATVQKMRR